MGLLSRARVSPNSDEVGLYHTWLLWANEASASPDFAEIHPRGVTAIHCCGTLLPLTSNLKGNATMSLPKRPQDLSATALMRVTSFAA